MWSGLISFFISPWDMVHSNINQQYSTRSCLFLHIFTGFVKCDIHQWKGFVWFSQSWPWHWCMPSFHLEWYYATNDSGVHFYFCSSVEASSPLKVLSFFMNFLWILMSFCDIYWTLWNHVMHVGLSWMTIELQWVIVH